MNFIKHGFHIDIKIACVQLVIINYFSFYSIHDLIRAGIMCADSLVVLSPSNIHSSEHESLADAENISSIHKIARSAVKLFPLSM